MKFTVNRLDIEALIRTSFHLPVDCEIVIDLEPALHIQITNALAPFHPTAEKIARIKALRTLFQTTGKKYAGAVEDECLGLGDAKFAVENFTFFMAFVKAHNRWPMPGYVNQPTGSNPYVLNLR